MSDYKLTPAERETIILWDEEADLVDIETYDSRLIRNLKKAASKNPEQYRYLGTNQHGGVSYEFPRCLLRVSFLKPWTDEMSRNRSQISKRVNCISSVRK